MTLCVQLLLAMCVLGSEAVSAQTAERTAVALDVPGEHARVTTDLANALVFIATEYKVPMVAELAATENPKLEIKARTETARQLLNLLVLKAPRYAWRERDGVVHFYQKALLDAPGDPLNLKLKTFQLPESVSELKMFLPARLHNASEGLQGGGGVVSAFPSNELDKEKLPARTFSDATGRDILLAAAASQPQFSSIIVLPNPAPQGQKDWDYASTHWYWFSLSPENRPLIR